jgi:beta-galactosidase
MVYEGTFLSDKLQRAVLKSSLQELGLVGPDQQLPDSIRTRTGTNDYKRQVHYYFNYAGKDVTFTYARKPGVDLLTGKRAAAGASVTLGPWEVAIIEEDGK